MKQSIRTKQFLNKKENKLTRMEIKEETKIVRKDFFNIMKSKYLVGYLINT